MVLDNATASADVPFNDPDTPASDVDKYSSQATTSKAGRYILAQSTPNQILVPFDQLPNVAPTLSIRSAERSQKLVAAIVRQRCDAAVNLLRRPLRQEEAEAFALNTAHAVRLTGIGPPIGLLIGSVNFWRTYNACTFPGGWYPGKHEKSTLSLDRFGPLKGATARAVWQVPRLAAHVGLWGIGTHLFFTMYGFSVLVVRVAADPRLKEYNEALRKTAQAKTPPREQDNTSTTQAETFDQRRQRRTVQAQARQSVQQRDNYDDASPTGGSFQDEFMGGSSRSELMDDAQTARKEDMPWSTGASRPEQTSERPASSQRPSQSQSVFDAIIPDASTPAKPTGSSWDRLRQQALESKPSGRT